MAVLPAAPAARAGAPLRPGPRLAVVGVGGAGLATLAWLADAGGVDADLVAVDRCPMALGAAGLPAAARPICLSVAAPPSALADRRAAAAADAAAAAGDALLRALDGADVVFVVAGLSGATGGGAAPAVAAAARRAGALVVGFGLAPFPFEPPAHHDRAAAAVAALAAACDATVTVDGDLALGAVGAELPLEWAAAAGREVVRRAAVALTAFADRGGCLAIGRSDLRALFDGGGPACFVVGGSDGPAEGTAGPADAAVADALCCPLADPGALRAAGRVLVQVTGGPDLTPADVDAAVARLRAALRPGCDVRTGVVTDVLLPGTARATLIGAALAPAADAADDAPPSVVPFARPAAAPTARPVRAVG